jgi:hypothetical protein
VLRLFSIFPTGAPGIALLILRFSLAGAVLDSCFDVLKSSVFPWMCLALAAAGALLCLGFLTPVVSVVACAFEMTALLLAGQAEGRFIALSSLNAIAIALLGPGAYSVDARLFGRREIVFPSEEKDDRH